MKEILLPFLVSAFLSSSPGLCADLIKVNGRAERKVPPDIAYLNIEAWSEGKTAKAAQEGNAREYARIEATLTQMHLIDRKNIRTESVSLNPEYRYPARGKPVITGYTSRHVLEITLRQISAIGPIIDSLAAPAAEGAKQGVNVHGVRFATEKADLYETTILEAAMKSARNRADALAVAAGRSVKGVRSIAHLTSTPVLLPSLAASALMEKSFAGAPSPQTQVPSGEITVSAEVAVEYEF